jgi:hypothetical protein
MQETGTGALGARRVHAWGVDLDLIHVQTLPRRQGHKEVSAESNTAKAVCVWGLVVLGSGRIEAFGVARRIVLSTTVADPDLEAIKANCIDTFPVPDLSTTDHFWGAEVDHPPWMHAIDPDTANSRRSVSVAVHVEQTVVGKGCSS